MATNRYAEFVRGALSHRGTVLPVDEIRITPGERECYRSMFVHGPALAEWVKSTGTVTGYKGPHAAEAFVVDVDSGDDLERARTDAVAIVRMLEAVYDVPVSYQRIAFSGAKGFHIAVPMQAIGDDYLRPNFARIFRGMADDIFEGFETVDRAIYESKRILRLNNTVNAKTGLHKIPISFDELCTDMDTIRALAASPRARGAVDVMPLDEIGRCPGIAGLFDQHAARVASSHTTSVESVPPPYDATADAPEPSAGETALLAAMQSGAREGTRNETLTKLAGLLLGKGFDVTMATAMLRGWNRLNTPPLGDDELASNVAGVFRRYAQSHDAAPGRPEIIDMRQAGENYVTYLHRMREARVRTGFPPLDEKLRAIAPGETICILGKTSVGKSALLQNFGRNYAVDSGAPVVMFSLEMPETSVFERSVQLEYGMRGYEVEQLFGGDDPEEVRRNIEAVYTSMPNFFIVKRSIDISGIIEYIQYAEANVYGRKTGLVLIDYLGLVKGRGNGIYEQVSRIAREMKDCAKTLDVPICYLSQVNRQYKIDQELDIQAARDSGSIEEAADYILGIWRAEESLQNVPLKMRCNIGILKNRKGGLAQYTAWMDKRSLQFEVEGDQGVSESAIMSRRAENVIPMPQIPMNQPLPF